MQSFLAFISSFTKFASDFLRRLRRLYRRPRNNPSDASATTLPAVASSTSYPLSSTKYPNKSDWIIASLLFCISLILVVTWLSNLVENLRSLPSTPKAGPQARTVPIVSDFTSDQGTSTVPNGQLIGSTTAKAHGTLVFHINQIKNETPTKAALSGTFSLTIPSDLQSAICDGTKIPNIMNDDGCSENGSVATEKSVCLSTSEGIVQKSLYQLKQEYASNILRLSVNTAPGGRSISTTSQLFSTTLKLEDIFPPSQSLLFSPGSCSSLSQPPDPIKVSFSETVTIPLSSQGRAYPDDWYVGTAWVHIALPSPLYIPDKLVGAFPIFYLPMDLKVAADTSMSNYNLQIVSGTTARSLDFQGNGPSVAFGDNKLTLIGTRNSSSWWLVYSTSLLIPIAFFIVFGHALFLSKRKNEEQIYITLLNVLTMVITVAAIRQLLVPADLQGEVTRLDLWLGMGGILLLLLFFVKYACTLIRTSAT